jgi:hypothetical protein
MYVKNCFYKQYIFYKELVKKNDRFVRQNVKFLTYTYAYKSVLKVICP